MKIANWTQISVKMVQRELVYRPMIHLMCQVLACLDTDDMVEVSVKRRQRLLVDSISRLLMVVPLVDLVRLLLRRRPHMAMRQCKADHHIIFGMQHSFLSKFNFNFLLESTFIYGHCNGHIEKSSFLLINSFFKSLWSKSNFTHEQTQKKITKLNLPASARSSSPTAVCRFHFVLWKKKKDGKR